ncbi:hypothetical protein H632_c182p2 [Helicosporidium sp. ATCC 50920]|nr:hypothetical protein H632_c182p2 [Helicosporidium sp. ATCC 50920]|eukprot:KDD76559.1 hypothetical protein H632_c182p2 [Helicosporidium sp. ATCC 50920]
MPWDGVRPNLEDPPGFDPADKFKDPVLYFKHREALVVNKYLEVSEAKYIRQKLRECYKLEGVNHLTECREVSRDWELAKKYIKAIEGAGVYKANSGPKDQATWGPSASS